MIKFFRKIRQKLLEQNRISKYLIYAMGEIFLVVIGILIALSINNWNENNKNKTKEHVYLNKISDNLNDDIAFYKSNIACDSLGIIKLSIIKEALSTDEGINAIAEAASSFLNGEAKNNRKKSIVSLLQMQRYLSHVETHSLKRGNNDINGWRNI